MRLADKFDTDLIPQVDNYISLLEFLKTNPPIEDALSHENAISAIYSSPKYFTK